MTHAPLYMTPPCGSPKIERAMCAGELGMITTPSQGNRMVAGVPWCRDNEVFAGKYLGDERFLASLDALAPYRADCRFVVAPDVVGNHWATVNRGYHMLAEIRERGFPVAFVAQPGIEYSAWDLWEEIDCLFIGGGDDWKESAAVANLVAVANSVGVWTHMGRVNTWARYQIAAAMGCDSVDGTLLTKGPDKNLPRVLRWRDKALAEADAMFGRPAPEFMEANGFNPDAPGRHRGRFTAAPAAPVIDVQLDLFAA